MQNVGDEAATPQYEPLGQVRQAVMFAAATSG